MNGNQLEVTHKFCKVTEHKVNTQNLLCLHAINKKIKMSKLKKESLKAVYLALKLYN